MEEMRKGEKTTVKVGCTKGEALSRGKEATHEMGFCPIY